MILNSMQLNDLNNITNGKKIISSAIIQKYKNLCTDVIEISDRQKFQLLLHKYLRRKYI